MLTLSSRFGFSPEDLDLNRTGQLSPRQRQTLRYRSAGLLVRGVAMIVLSIILTAAIHPLISSPVEAGAVAVMQLLLVLVCALWLRAAYRTMRPELYTVTGVVTRHSTRPLILVGNHALRISYRRWKRLPDQLPGDYRVFYCTGDFILSLEPMDKPL